MQKLQKFYVHLALLVTVLSLLLVSCSGMSSLSPDKLRLELDKSYKFTVNIQYGDNDSEAAAQFERRSADIWEVTLTEPYALAGMTLSYNKGNVTAVYEGIQTTADSSEAVYTGIINAFENAVTGEGWEVSSSGNEIRITSKAGTPANSYVLTLDKSNHQPLSLKMPDIPLKAEFSQVQVSQIEQVFFTEGANTDGITPNENSGLRITPQD